jgi:hypothetical protein
MVKTVPKYRYRCEVIAANGRASGETRFKAGFPVRGRRGTEIVGEARGARRRSHRKSYAFRLVAIRRADA